MSFLKIDFYFKGESQLRLDLILSNYLANNYETTLLSRSKIQKLIKANQVLVNKKIQSKPSILIQPDSFIELTIPKEKSLELEPYDFPLKIIYEDDSLLVLNKPHSIIMHPGVGEKRKTILNALIHYARGEFNPKLVHRLDKDTTGLCLIAKNEDILAKLQSDLRERTVVREYLALVLGSPKQNKIVQQKTSGKLIVNLGRDSKNRTLISVVDTGGRESITEWERLDNFTYAAYLKIKLQTGRTHQIRVTMNHLNSPVIGDRSYGNFFALPKDLQKITYNFGRQALHAAILSFEHPLSKEKLSFSIEPPKDMLKLIEMYKNYE